MISIRDISTNDLLAEYALTRGEIIRDEIIKRHITLAREIGQRYARAFGERYCDLDDFINWAMEGLWKAVEEFDESLVKVNKPLERKLILFVSKKMRFNVVDRYRRNLPYSRSGRQLAQKHEEYLYDYFKENGRYPTDEEIETYLNSIYDVNNRGKGNTPLLMEPNRENTRKSVQLNQPSPSVEAWHSAATEDKDDFIEGKRLIDRIFNCNKYRLDEFDRQVLFYLYVKEMGVIETAEQMKVHGSVICNARDRLLKRLRGALYREQQELKEAFV